MSDKATNDQNSTGDAQYQVVALRYRPQAFEDLVGQGHVSQALSNAIESNRVGHAYLFTGARGVGKTSSARIFAKCLNCEQGPTPTPCNECEVCKSVSIGEDVDVLEIDGASNRGIDEIRQLRSNAAIRPGRGRFKIYIIDEVHMLTTQAFNALLKTLEEPPAHVKFIFCTTDPQKIPITVLSRCQRYDFSPVQPNEITNRLKEIATNEGVDASDEALQMLARRANGSMRDSQSLLEQLFSFCADKISLEAVHQLLGTTDMSRIAELASAMAAHDSQTTLNLIHDSVAGGVDAGQLTDQLLGYFRDMIVAHVGCRDEVLQNCAASDAQQLRDVGGQLGLQTMLTIVQVLDSAVVRMQTSLHARTLLEVAAIRICNLEHLESISDLVNSLTKMPGAKAIVSASTGVKKKIVKQSASPAEPAKPDSPSAKLDASPEKEIVEPAVATSALAAVGAVAVAAVVSETTAAVATGELAAEQDSEPETVSANPAAAGGDLETLYRSAMQKMGDMTADMAVLFDTIKEHSADHIEVALFDPMHCKRCSRKDCKSKIEEVLQEVAGRHIRIDFVVSKNAPAPKPSAPTLSRAQQIRELNDNEFVKQAITIFDSEIADFHQRR